MWVWVALAPQQAFVTPFTAGWWHVAGSGRAPKLGPKLGHSPAKGRVTAPGDGSTKSDWPLPAPIDDAGWSDETVEWWAAAVASPSASAWTEFEFTKMRKLVVMTEHWWRLARRNPTEAFRSLDVLRRAEEELYLSPKARALAGIVVDQRDQRQPT